MFFGILLKRKTKSLFCFFTALHTVASIYYRYSQIYRGQKRVVLNNFDEEKSQQQQQQQKNNETEEEYDDDGDENQDENNVEIQQMYDGELTPV
jgi:hypothetical protein